MIIVRVPFRLPLAGGGTDLDFYYKIKGGKLEISESNNAIPILFSLELIKEWLIS